MTFQPEHDKLVALLEQDDQPYRQLTSKAVEVYLRLSDSEEGLIYYVMYMPDDGAFLCTCRGWRFNGKCKHMEEVRSGVLGLAGRT